MIKNRVKLLIDILMVLVFIMLMCNQLTGLIIHEKLGVVVILLFIIHQILNINYYKNLFKGKYSKLRIAYLIINSLLMLYMILMIISAIFISQYEFEFMNFHNYTLGREIHISSVYSIYMLTGLHLGLHYNTIIKFKKQNKIIINTFFVLFSLIFGIKGFIKKQFIEKITLKSLYPLYSEDNIVIFLIDYIGIFIMFTMLGYGIYNLINFKKNNKIRREM